MPCCDSLVKVNVKEVVLSIVNFFKVEFSDKLSHAKFISQSLFWSIDRNKCQSALHGDGGEAAQITTWSRGRFRADSCDLSMPDVPNLSLSRCHSWLGECIWVRSERSDEEKSQKGQTQH